MGRRHQLFAIAKIDGRYRNLCAIHHQWLYGHTALRRCLDTLKIFEAAANRMPIQQELIAASRRDSDFLTPKEIDYRRRHSPLPFIATCLIVGASFNIDGYYHQVIIEPFGMAFDEGDNNNGGSSLSPGVLMYRSPILLRLPHINLAGITIFDITDLSKVRYCFVDWCGMESDWAVDLMTPLSARTYLEAYFDLDAETSLKPLVQKFEGIALITTAALKKTWPEGDWQEDEISAPEASNSTDNPELLGTGTAAVSSDPSVAAEKTTGNASTTLRDRSMDMLLDAIVNQSAENPDLIAEAEVLSDFIPKLRLRLYDQAMELRPSAHLSSLLHKALEKDDIVDFSPFKNLTVGCLTMLFAGLRDGSMRVLNLSNMPDLTDADLESILDGGPALSKDLGSASPTRNTGALTTGNLKAIILLETPNITLDFLTKKLGHCDIYHSELLWRPLRPLTRSEVPLPWLKFDAPNAVSHLVAVGISSIQACNKELRLESGRMDWGGLRYSVKASTCFSGDPNIKYKSFLMDVPLPVSKTIHSLQRLLQYLTSPNLGWVEDWPKAAARCFATTSLQRDGSDYGVGPLSTTLYKDDDRDDYVENGKGQLLEPGEWAIVLVHEAFDAKDQEALDKQELNTINQFRPRGVEGLKEWPEEEEVPTFKPLKRLRYVLAKALPDSGPLGKQFLATDALGYVQHIMGGDGAKELEAKILSDWWKKENSGLRERFDYYGDDDVHELLQKIYSNDVSNQDDPSQPKDIMKFMTLRENV